MPCDATPSAVDAGEPHPPTIPMRTSSRSVGPGATGGGFRYETEHAIVLIPPVEAHGIQTYKVQCSTRNASDEMAYRLFEYEGPYFDDIATVIKRAVEWLDFQAGQESRFNGSNNE